MDNNSVLMPLVVILCGFLGMINLINQRIAESSLQYWLCFISGLLVAFILILVFKIFINMKNSQGN
ncbi:hypothetical protein A9507_12360 [Methanobacterium sp. A39]|uniref:Uncharacterized protein n=1 Tax=Methanobacterium bryantii TaxID=2161 RepID=A0A2A2H6S9_METBR|nr:hypothetical protein A9507_12360 [Methanobacterium sp. A39]PAV05014.1 hypothetical protein ASJ80_11975 [Methanobacterium bryantii]